MDANNKIWTRTIKCGREQYKVGADNKKWTRTIKSGREQQNVDANDKMWTRTIKCGREQCETLKGWEAPTTDPPGVEGFCMPLDSCKSVGGGFLVYTEKTVSISLNPL